MIPDPETVAQIKEDILQLAPHIQEASEGKAQLTASSVQVVNRVTLDHTITLSDPGNPYSCMLDGGYWNNPWAQLAQEALLKAGISPSEINASFLLHQALDVDRIHVQMHGAKDLQVI